MRRVMFSSIELVHRAPVSLVLLKHPFQISRMLYSYSHTLGLYYDAHDEPFSFLHAHSVYVAMHALVWIEYIYIHVETI